MEYPVLKLNQADYPAPLLEIPEIPKQLYIRGQRWNPEHKFLCVVGSRSYTQYGKQVVEKLIAGLAGFPITIVSGLAMGIDALAHIAAMKAGLGVIAVPGSGINDDVLYPSTNRKLAQEILTYGGCLISEFDPHEPSKLYMFPRRNRIMAALSHAVLIVEAEIKSGTLITARLATEYCRDVMVVPGSIFSVTSEGPHMLLALGATPIRNSKDILDALHFASLECPDVRSEIYKELSKEERTIVTALIEPMKRDDLIAKLAKPASEVLGILMMLEIKGIIKEELGEIRLV